MQTAATAGGHAGHGQLVDGWTPRSVAVIAQPLHPQPLHPASGVALQPFKGLFTSKACALQCVTYNLKLSGVLFNWRRLTLEAAYCSH